MGKGTLQAVFRERLRAELNARGMSQNELSRRARALGITVAQKSVSNILAGKGDSHLSTVNNIADTLQINPLALLTLDVREPAGAPRAKVIPMALPPYPPILGKPAESPKGAKKRKRR